MADISKFVSYAVQGGPSSAAAATKLTAYAVLGSSLSYQAIGKLVAYAVVIEAAATTARPQVFVCT